MKKIAFIFLLLTLQLQATNYDALLFHGNCTTCHFENETVSAPSVVAFRARYLSAFAEKKDFVDYMATWVEHPREETSLMHDAIDKHGLMPELAFDIETLRSIASYIYDTDFSKKHEGHKSQLQK